MKIKHALYLLFGFLFFTWACSKTCPGFSDINYDNWFSVYSPNQVLTFKDTLGNIDIITIGTVKEERIVNSQVTCTDADFGNVSCKAAQAIIQSKEQDNPPANSSLSGLTKFQRLTIAECQPVSNLIGFPIDNFGSTGFYFEGFTVYFTSISSQGLQFSDTGYFSTYNDTYYLGNNSYSAVQVIGKYKTTATDKILKIFLCKGKGLIGYETKQNDVFVLQ